MMKNFRTYHIAVEFYRASSKTKFPSHLREQFSRASSSIVLNLAEGAGRFGAKDQRRFYSIAFASLRECQAILVLADVRDSQIEEIADRLAAHIFRLIKS